MARKLRLWSGLVLFIFVGTHQINHALGIISLETLEAGRLVFLAFWRSPVGTALLYPAFLIHVNLVLWALYQRRYLRMPKMEVFRLILGLVMPLVLTPHIFGTRVVNLVFGVEDSYTYVVGGMAVDHLDSAILQNVLLLVAWTHGCLGIHWWLRLKPWYPAALPWLRAGALLLPTFAILGFVDAGKKLRELAAQPGFHAIMIPPESLGPNDAVLGWSGMATGLFLVSVLAVFVGRWLRARIAQRRGSVRLRYPTGQIATVPVGATVLEASRSVGIPHASLCGGRGRCSTCRTRVGVGALRLPPPAPEEQRVLQRVAAPPNVRLACQLRPTNDLDVYPLLPATAQPAEGFLRPPHTTGTEREIAILFADIRSFTTFSERRFPYDVVFMLNQYFAAMGEAIGRAGGHLDKFIGDGVMALFGVGTDARTGCLQALEAAVNMSHALDALNRTLEQDLTEPLRIGIGIHIGPAIVGEMGYRPAFSLTAIGDAVNTASRLESMNKQFHSQLIVSDDVGTTAGVDLSGFSSHTLEVRGRSEPLPVRVIANATELERLLTVAPGA
ncbi:MAG: adenylate/guanylate cyclase domain-containing protein [Chloroflexota bacterium]